MCAVRLLHADMHTDLGQSNPLVATPRHVYVLRGIRQAQFSKVFIHFEFGHSKSLGARSLFFERRQLCQIYASLNGLVWLLTHERFSLPHRSASTQQDISHSYSICLHAFKEDTCISFIMIDYFIMPSIPGCKHRIMQTSCTEEHPC